MENKIAVFEGNIEVSEEIGQLKFLRFREKL